MARNDATESTGGIELFGTPMSVEDARSKMSGARSRNMYGPLLRQFIESGHPGVSINLDSGPLSGKSHTTVKQGFDNALRKVRELATEGKTDDPAYVAGAESVKVTTEGNKIALLNTSAV